MYAAYQVDGPSQKTVRSTNLTKDDDQFDEVISSGNVFQGRILRYCVAGTLGLLTPMYLHASSATANWNINQIEFDGAQVVATEAASSAFRDITHIRKVMKISVSELARVFGVSRQAVHEWIKGGALSPRNAQRLSEFAQVADVFVESGIDVMPQMLRRKVGSGPSLLECVMDGGKVVEQARQLVDTLSREAQQRQRLAERLSGRPKVAVSSDAFGSLHLRENT
jgi:DNA-binding transcriptional regulator YiaG